MLRTLQPHMIHVWMARPNAIRDPELLANYERLLTAEELQRQRRFRFERDRHEALVTRALVRTVLSSYADVDPAEWRFEAGSAGKPEIVHPPVPLHFNVSHTDGMIVCAVTRGAEIGIDVEYLDHDTNIEALARRKFAPTEAAELLGLSQDERRSRFFDLWTLKESYVKACGHGLAIPLDSFAFTINDAERIGSVNRGVTRSRAERQAGELGDESSEWTHWLIYPAPEYRIAITVAGRLGDTGTDLQFFECVPLAWHERVELPIEAR